MPGSGSSCRIPEVALPVEFLSLEKKKNALHKYTRLHKGGTTRSWLKCYASATTLEEQITLASPIEAMCVGTSVTKSLFVCPQIGIHLSFLKNGLQSQVQVCALLVTHACLNFRAGFPQDLCVSLQEVARHNGHAQQ